MTSPLLSHHRRSRPRRLGGLLLALGAIVALAVPLVGLGATSTSAGTPFCTDASRACVISAATTYIDALVSHDSSEVRLAPGAIRTENGYDTGDSGAQIASGLATNPQYLVVHDIHDVRWFVDGDEAIAFYLLDAAVPVIGTHIATSHIAERFQVIGGLITQIEAIDCTHPGLSPEPERQSTVDAIASEQCLGQ